jgi:ABC-type nitrate/sulfonate/bicarbonate transport system substrate-binding protein
MIRLNRVLVLIILSLLSIGEGRPLWAENIRVGVTGSGPEFTPFYAGKAGGFFKKHGLDAEIIRIPAASLVVQSLLGGSLDFAIVGQAYIRAAAQGADVVMVSTYVNRFPYTVLVKPSIKRPEDIKDAKLGISRFGSASEVAFRVLLEHLGMNPDKDVTFLQVGGQTDRFMALKSGAIDGTVIAPPLSGIADKLGFNVYYKMLDLKIDYPHEGVVVSREYARTRGDTVTRFLKGYIESMHAMKKDKKFAISMIAKDLRLDPASHGDELEGAYQESVLGMYEGNPRPNTQGVKFIIDLMKKEKNFVFRAPTDPKHYVDASFMEQLNKSGYLKSLYGK